MTINDMPSPATADLWRAVLHDVVDDVLDRILLDVRRTAFLGGLPWDVTPREDPPWEDPSWDAPWDDLYGGAGASGPRPRCSGCPCCGGGQPPGTSGCGSWPPS